MSAVRDRSEETLIGSTATLVSDAYHVLRRDILTSVLKPDQKLGIDGLRNRYSIGSGPLREALSRLVAEGLVLQKERRGFYVPAVSRDDLHRLTESRCHMYDLTLSLSIQHGDAQWEERIVLAFHRMSRLPRFDADQESSLRWEAAHREFHLALIAGCPYPLLIEFTETLSDYADRYRSLIASAPRYRRDAAEEHAAIKDATLARDIPRAIRLLSDHIRETAKSVVKLMDAESAT